MVGFMHRNETRSGFETHRRIDRSSHWSGLLVSIPHRCGRRLKSRFSERDSQVT